MGVLVVTKTQDCKLKSCFFFPPQYLCVLLKNIQNHNWNYKINLWLIILIQKHSQFMLIKQDFKTRRIVLITSSNRLQISVQLMQSVAEAQWWRVRAKATPLEQKTLTAILKFCQPKYCLNDYSRNCTFALTSELRIVSSEGFDLGYHQPE